MLPWALYNLTARDQASAIMRPVQRIFSSSVAAPVPAWQQTYTVPDEHFLLLTWASVSAVATAPDIPDVATLEIQDEFSAAHFTTGFQVANTARTPQRMYASWNGSPLALIPEKHKVVGVVNLTAAAGAAWNMVMAISGVLIPKGTLANL